MSGIPEVEDAARHVAPDARARAIVAALGGRSIVLVGLMGSGKTAIGRRLAHRLGLEFVDSDAEIEWAAGMTIPEIFARYGEPYFRDGERRVMARLLVDGARVIATGGGAFMTAETRVRIAESAVSIWLKGDLEVLWRRVRKRTHRPLLQNSNPEATLRKLMDERYPTYAKADVTVISREGPHEAVVEEALAGLERHIASGAHKHAGAAKAQAELFEKVRVDLGTRSYDICIGDGLVAQAGSYIAAVAPGASAAIVSDANVAGLHLERLHRSLAAAGIRYADIVVAPGEGSKSFAVFETVCKAILDGKFERGDIVIALGGGVIGDLAGYAAASVRRGMRFVQIPTSLLAQVDSSVGGKTGINAPQGKNLIGAFHQPSLVLADMGCLATLPPREFRAGYAEIVKYGLIRDADFFEWLDANWREVFAGGAARIRAIAKSCEAKADVVAGDEFEAGDRALLNFGHTFGHALERLVSYDGRRLVHGEGVAIGMACAARFSVRRGLCAPDVASRVEAHLRAVGLPVHIRDIDGWNLDAAAILDAMYQDKKVVRGALTFILIKAIGHCFIAKNVDAGEVRAFLEDELG
ncbi:MAG: 3-dehydroquinate synthase [Beijerinckiaceae bacterium]|nr:MAG: 3-dehydroquinate synthase [Beijerinckiaceae bacterium]